MSVAAPIRGDDPASFAWSVLHRRHPALLRQVMAAYPYDPPTRAALDRLAAEVADDVIRPLGTTSGHAAGDDVARWDRWALDYYGQRYSDVPFLWAESFFYRKILDSVGYHATGTWHGVDPFAPAKRAELDDASRSAAYAASDAMAARTGAGRDAAVLSAALWGNRADLGFLVLSGQTQDDDDESGHELVADDSASLWSVLDRGAPGTVCVVADNAGRESLADLLLIDHLLESGRAASVTLQVKSSPYYVSDAMTRDVLDCLNWLRRRPSTAATGDRLWAALGAGRLTLRCHDFWTAPLPCHELPDDLAAEFAAASLTIFKGDLNYRRLVGDQAWPNTSSFAERVAYFPGAVATLRTLKCDVVVGVEASTLARLDAAEPDWRVSGRHALVQVRA